MSHLIDWTTMKNGTRISLNWTGASGGSYTAPSFGFVMVQAACADSKSVTVKVNGNDVAKAQGSNSLSYEWIPIMVMVGKGDIVQATSSDSGGNAQVIASSCYFYPVA